ncbi:MAG: iron-regulated protein [Leptolyngbyaceae cyanobacterium RU_5_1]|nr:iron-regulated protein [Leptolyngbyaceae cyanobacterium RU_5_1]
MGHSFSDLGAEILLIENLLEPDFCAHLIQVAECCEFESPPRGMEATGSELRSGEVLLLDNRNPLLESTNQLLLSKVNRIRGLLTKRYAVVFSQAEMYSIERYRPGERYKRHLDGLVLSNRYEELARGIPARDVTVIGFLNDNFEGGEILFDRQSLKVKPSIGSAIAFPAYYTHPYQALPVLRGCKYIFLSWLIR